MDSGLFARGGRRDFKGESDDVAKLLPCKRIKDVSSAYSISDTGRIAVRPNYVCLYVFLYWKWVLRNDTVTGRSDMYYLEVGSIRFTDTVEQELGGLKFCAAWSWSYG